MLADSFMLFSPDLCVDDGLQRNKKRKFAARARFTLYPYFTAHSLYESPGNGETKTHTFRLRLARGKTEKIVEYFNVIFGRNSRAGIGNAHLHGVRGGEVLPPALAGRRFGCRAAFPHVRLGMEPYGAALGRELRRIFEQVGDRALDLCAVERKLGQFVVGEKIESQPSFLKAMRPDAADFRQTCVHVRRFVLHLHLACLKDAESEKILYKTLQPLTTGVH